MADAEFRACMPAARSGDEAAWAELYGWLAPQVLGFLRSARVPDPEDVLGEVFLEVARRVDGFKGDARGFRAWVFTIARSRRVDAIRRRSRRPVEPLDGPGLEAMRSTDDVEGEALAIVGLEELLVVLEDLTDDQSEVLVLRALGGWTAREVGEITGRSTGSVEQLQHRALAALRELLDPS
jgi:RNA polymerase sigma-70 factor (ECF subfamily)